MTSYFSQKTAWRRRRTTKELMIAGTGETIALIYLLTVFLPFIFIIITNCCLPFMFASHRRTSNLRSSRDNASVETELAKTTIIEVISLFFLHLKKLSLPHLFSAFYRWSLCFFCWQFTLTKWLPQLVIIRLSA